MLVNIKKTHVDTDKFAQLAQQGNEIVQSLVTSSPQEIKHVPTGFAIILDEIEDYHPDVFAAYLVIACGSAIETLDKVIPSDVIEELLGKEWALGVTIAGDADEVDVSDTELIEQAVHTLDYLQNEDNTLNRQLIAHRYREISTMAINIIKLVDKGSDSKINDYTGVCTGVAIESFGYDKMRQENIMLKALTSFVESSAVMIPYENDVIKRVLTFVKRPGIFDPVLGVISDTVDNSEEVYEGDEHLLDKMTFDAPDIAEFILVPEGYDLSNSFKAKYI